eukprot:600308-Hanusia_phi.AAC.1
MAASMIRTQCLHLTFNSGSRVLGPLHAVSESLPVPRIRARQSRLQGLPLYRTTSRHPLRAPLRGSSTWGPSRATSSSGRSSQA